MRIGRAIIIPVILSLSVAGSVLSGPGIALAAGHTPTAHVQTSFPSTISGVYYHN